MRIAREFFRDLIDQVFRNQRIDRSLSAEEYVATEEYLVDLLERFLRHDCEDDILSKSLLYELQYVLNADVSHEGWRRFMRVRDIGDASLFTAGILHSYALRSIVGIHNYVSVGESAYKILFMSADEHDRLSLVFHRFSHNLKPFVRVLAEIGHEHVFKNKLDDIVYVWGRYAKYGNPEDGEWLRDQGVALLPEFGERG